jgi:alanine dehydrogenase
MSLPITIDVTAILDHICVSKINKVIENSFRMYAEKQCIMPPKLYLDLPEFNGDFRAMPAYLKPLNIAGIKWVSVHPDNQDISSVMATLILNDPHTGRPLAIMDGTLITAFRTGAASAIAINYLSTQQSSSLALIGCGAQAWYQYLCITKVRPINTIYLCDFNDHHRSDLLQKIKGHNPSLNCIPTTIENACCNSDIIVTLTPSRTPIINNNWVRPGTHINAIGADAPGKQELDISLLMNNLVYIDDWGQASHSGEINNAVRLKKFSQSNIIGSIGDVICEQCPGRQHDSDITIFDSTGLALQDIALGHFIYMLMKKKRL